MQPDKDIHEEPKQLDPSDIREVYKEFGNNARSYMDLKFKHFATFSVLTTFLGTAAYQNRSIEQIVHVVAVLGLVASSLFWILDHRTGQYLKYYWKQTRSLEERFIPDLITRDQLLPRIPPARIAGASAITNIIFTVITLAWAGLLITSLVIGAPGKLNGASGTVDMGTRFRE